MIGKYDILNISHLQHGKGNDQDVPQQHGKEEVNEAENNQKKYLNMTATRNIGSGQQREPKKEENEQKKSLLSARSFAYI
jgi:hypothetical protein